MGGGGGGALVAGGGGAASDGGGAGAGGGSVTVTVSGGGGGGSSLDGGGGGGGGGGVVVVISSCTGGADVVEVGPPLALRLSDFVPKTSIDTDTTSEMAAMIATMPTTHGQRGGRPVSTRSVAVVVVVVVEAGIGGHIGAAGELLGFRRRIRPRMNLGLAGRIRDVQILRGSLLARFLFRGVRPFGIRPGGFGPLIYAYPSRLLHRRHSKRLTLPRQHYPNR